MLSKHEAASVSTSMQWYLNDTATFVVCHVQYSASLHQEAILNVTIFLQLVAMLTGSVHMCAFLLPYLLPPLSVVKY